VAIAFARKPANLGNSINAVISEDVLETRTKITYPELFMDMLKEALHLFFSSNVHLYISVGNAYFLFNSMLEKAIKAGILDTAKLDLKYTSDEKPKGLRKEYQKVLHENFIEQKRTSNTTLSLWYLKKDKRIFKEKVADSIQDFLIDIADKVVTKHVAAHGTARRNNEAEQYLLVVQTA
jgi:hypothetical protein